VAAVPSGLSLTPLTIIIIIIIINTRRLKYAQLLYYLLHAGVGNFVSRIKSKHVARIFLEGSCDEDISFEE
jgi:lipoprotein signal peptidase